MITIDFTGKTALITGGTRGIGRGISRLFAEAGANTAAVYRADEASAATSVGERQAAGPGAHRNYVADLADPTAPAAIASVVTADFPTVDFLILNAAAGLGGALPDIEQAAWQRLFQVNLTSALLLAQAFVPIMPAGGAIVSIASGAGHEPLPGLVAYGTSKAALIHFATSLAHDVGPLGIRSNVVSPGFTDTSFGGGVASDERKQSIASQTALRRVGVPEDIARVVLFFCSDLSGFVTGQAIRVNGGRI